MNCTHPEFWLPKEEIIWGSARMEEAKMTGMTLAMLILIGR